MLISRKTDYAVRCVMFLAGRPGELSSTSQIAAYIDVTDVFVAKILQTLARCGVIESVRGTHGGYRLAHAPGGITLLDVVEAIQGPVQLNECVVEGRGCALDQSCPVHSIWVDVRRDLEAQLRSKTFDQLAAPGRSPTSAR